MCVRSQEVRLCLATGDSVAIDRLWGRKLGVRPTCHEGSLRQAVARGAEAQRLLDEVCPSSGSDSYSQLAAGLSMSFAKPTGMGDQ